MCSIENHYDVTAYSLMVLKVGGQLFVSNSMGISHQNWLLTLMVQVRLQRSNFKAKCACLYVVCMQLNNTQASYTQLEQSIVMTIPELLESSGTLNFWRWKS